MPQPEIVVESDYEGYFESMVRHQLTKVAESKRERIIISSGPYRSYGCQFEISEDGKVLKLDFYSALRRGFGSFNPSDLIEVL